MSKKEFIQKFDRGVLKVISVVAIVCCILILLASTLASPSLGNQIVTAGLGATRGQPGDLWADSVLGKRDFGEDAPREVVPDKVSSPGGVIVDQNAGTAGEAYIWDSGNSRIIGIDLAACYALNGSSRCLANIVIGQPSATDWGACNQDASFQFYPNKAPSSASTLCGIPEWTHTTLEHKSFSSMFVDASGNLWVADYYNHRVLEYNTPLTTDTVADQVWGQTDFTGNLCNQAGGFNQSVGSPTASTLCFESTFNSGAGVALDSSGNLWVADGGNERVLRFPKVSGTISKTADIVIGESNFTTGGDSGGGTGNNQLRGPTSLGFDGSGNLYVSDSGNNRVMKYAPPFTSNMNGTVFLNSAKLPDGVVSIQMDPSGNSMFTYENNAKFDKWNLSGTKIVTQFTNANEGAGSIGIDSSGNLIISSYQDEQDVTKYTFNSGTNTYDSGQSFFGSFTGYNLTSANRLEQGGWGGLGVESNGQLVLTDGRLLFWNNAKDAANGAPPDGYVGGSSATDLTPNYSVLAVDKDDKIYVEKDNSSIYVYQGPLTNSSSPIQIIFAPYNLLGGGTTMINSSFGGIAVSDHGEFLWISDPGFNRVLRIKNPLTSPVVDTILGQTTSTATDCNRGLVQQPNVDSSSHASLDMLCIPGALSLDNFGNLYVSDHFFESVGNWRMLMFSASTFPDSPSSILFAPAATKEFPRNGVDGSTQAHATFEAAFDSTNRMVVGYNPYLGPRFIQYYNDPTSFNPSDKSDPTFANPDGSFNDFYGWPYALTFDNHNNLYVYDTNRGKVFVYDEPFMPILGEVTAVPTTTADSTPSYTFSTTQAGSITYGGSCSSGTTSAVSGNNTIDFNTLSPGTYSNCTVQITSSDSNHDQSDLLNVSSFTVISSPVLTEVTPVATPTTDTTPNYTFNSTTVGTITYGGSCSSATTSAVIGNNTVTFNSLNQGTYSNCTIKVTDNNSFQSNALSVSTFTISFKPFGDFNQDNKVDLSDLSILASTWQQHVSTADANNDGVVDLSDLSILAQNWQRNL